jgi:SagB-type dehydrogenase family enzyme
MRLSIERPAAGLLAALHTLSANGATVEQLAELVVWHDGINGLPWLFASLQRFATQSMLCYAIVQHEQKLATLVPLTSSWPGLASAPLPQARYQLSRFAYLRRDDAQFILESPLTHATLLLHDWRVMALLHVCVTPHSLQEIGEACAALAPLTVALCVRVLLSCQALVDVSHGQALERQPTLHQWCFHDLLFHSRSRLGRHTNPYGATYRFAETIAPLPAMKAPMSEMAIELPTPASQALMAHDISLTQALETRRSRRQHAVTPLTLLQLGEFLYRTARVSAVTDTEPYVRSRRPYPSGGACYELEIYVVVHACADVSPGLYHYGPHRHQLYKVAERTRHVETLLQGAAMAAGLATPPHVLLILAARFARVAWKYDAMAYALILKHVGVLYQTMYLVATAMGLAACALGGGDSDAFCAAAGTDYYTETSVGEFILGCPVSEESTPLTTA